MPPRATSSAVSFVCKACQRQIRRDLQKRFASTNPEIYDVVTVGGGPVGLALMAALKASPLTSHLKTALIETQCLTKQRHWNLPPDQYSNRASSLTPSSIQILESSGAWQHIDQSRIQPYNEMQVWDAGNDSSIQFDWKDEARRYNAPPRTVATMTENANLTKALLNRISELKADSSLLSNTKVTSIDNGEDDPDGIDLSTWPVLNLSPITSSPTLTTSQPPSSPTSIAARLLVGADGFSSPVRSFAAIPSHGWDYNRHGVVATLNLQPSHTSCSYSSDPPSYDYAYEMKTAFQRFLPTTPLGGPIAILPLPDNKASLVWSTTPSTAKHLSSLPLESLTAILNAALTLEEVDIIYLLSLPASTTMSTYVDEIQWRQQHTPPPALTTPVPVIESIQPHTLASFPLRFRHVSTLTSPRVALVGDAAHTIHPMAGQGLNLGLADAAALHRNIEYSVEHGMDIGALGSLESYGRERFGKGLMMAGGVDLMQRVWSVGGTGTGSGGLGGLVNRVVGRMRGLGMGAVGGSAWVKGRIMGIAEGR